MKPKPMTGVLLSIIVTTTAISSLAQSAVPEVRLFISPLFDAVCAEKTQYQIEQAWKSELNSLFPVLVTAWQQDGVKLLDATQKVTGIPFEQKEFDATLSICSFPSMSHPLLINMRYALSSFTGTPHPMHVTLSIIHHEILHHYLLGKIPRDSHLLDKYKNEDPRVRVHLHLLALQKAVFLELGMGQELQDVIRKDESLPPGLYKKAWEIVNSEGHLPFLNEIKSVP